MRMRKLSFQRCWATQRGALSITFFPFSENGVESSLSSQLELLAVMSPGPRADSFRHGRGYKCHPKKCRGKRSGAKGAYRGGS